MKLFISWSGTVSQQIAQELRDWLPLILPAVRPFITSSDIDKGARWQGDISRELEQSNFGIVCLTKDNRNSQWLAFEAGALSKHLSGRVATILFGLDHADVPSPLSMFQGTKFEATDVQKLILSIDSAVGEAEQRRGVVQLEQIFPMFWDRLKAPVDLILKAAPTADEPKTTIDYADVVQEVLAQLRQQNNLLSDPARLFAPVISKIEALSKGLAYQGGNVISTNPRFAKQRGNLDKALVDYVADLMRPRPAEAAAHDVLPETAAKESNEEGDGSSSEPTGGSL